MRHICLFPKEVVPVGYIWHVWLAQINVLTGVLALCVWFGNRECENNSVRSRRRNVYSIVGCRIQVLVGRVNGQIK